MSIPLKLLWELVLRWNHEMTFKCFNYFFFPLICSPTSFFFSIIPASIFLPTFEKIYVEKGENNSCAWKIYNKYGTWGLIGSLKPHMKKKSGYKHTSRVMLFCLYQTNVKISKSKYNLCGEPITKYKKIRIIILFQFHAAYKHTSYACIYFLF